MKEHEENRGEDNVVHLALDVVTQIQIYMQKKKNQSCTFNTCTFYIIELYLNFFKKTKKKKIQKNYTQSVNGSNFQVVGMLCFDLFGLVVYLYFLIFYNP